MKKLTFKIQLEGIKPAIWRVLQVPSEMSVEDFAVNIQIAMGWTYSHLYGFTIEDREYWNSEFMENVEDDDNVYPYDDMLVEDLLAFEKPVTFIYDFGDTWRHSVKLIHTEEYAKGERKCAKILDGARCCPPEDVGGIYGFKEMLDILKRKPHSEEAQSYLTWLGGTFNPERFNIREVASDLAFYRMHHIFPGAEPDELDFIDPIDGTKYYS